MQNVLHERLNSGATIAVMPCNDVVHRINFRPLEFWAHVPNLLFEKFKSRMLLSESTRPCASDVLSMFSRPKESSG